MYVLPVLFNEIRNLMDYYDFFDPDEFVYNNRSKLIDNNDSYEIRVEVPGLKKDDIDIVCEKDGITISCEWKEKNNYSLRSGKFKRFYRITDYEMDKVEAQLSDGILTIKAPKNEKSISRKIKIKGD